jgi:type III secretion system HrpE/YscL family protein
MGRLVTQLGRVVPSDVLDAQAQAATIVDAARRTAQQVVGDAHAAADAIRAEARRDGEAAGHAAAEEAFTTLLVGARADAERVRRAALSSARALAVRMAEKIVGQVVSLDEAALIAIAGQAMDAVRARTGTVVLRVHPDDLAAMHAARPALVAHVSAAVDLRLIADASVGRNGCVVETPVGRVDGRLDTQLAALERAVFGDRPTSTDGTRDA